MSTVSWDIDADDRLCAFSGTWLAGATGVDRETLAPARLLGRPLLSLFSEGALRDAYARLLRSARQHRRGIRFVYRCDAAAERRLYLLRLAPRPDGGIHFATHLVRKQPRPPQPGWERSGSAPVTAWDFCSQCNRIALPPAGWCELEYVSPLPFFAGRGAPRFWPTLCPSCLDALRAAAAA